MYYITFTLCSICGVSCLAGSNRCPKFPKLPQKAIAPRQHIERVSDTARSSSQGVRGCASLPSTNCSPLLSSSRAAHPFCLPPVPLRAVWCFVTFGVSSAPTPSGSAAASCSASRASFSSQGDPRPSDRLSAPSRRSTAHPTARQTKTARVDEAVVTWTTRRQAQRSSSTARRHLRL